MKFIKAILLLCFCVICAGCSQTAKNVSLKEQTKENLTIYTTVYPLQYVVEEIGGDTVTVKSVYPPGADGHTYEPTTKEMTRFAESDAFIYIGEGMEGFSDSIANALGRQSVELIAIGEYTQLFQKYGHDHDDHSHEEHENEHAITINGLSAHYHSGDTIELIADYEKTSEQTHLQWSILEPGANDWELIEEQTTDHYVGEATINQLQVKVALYNDAQEVIAESTPVTVVIDNHEENDPHIWTDPLRVIKVAEIIKDELITLNPNKKELYTQNFEKLKIQLTELDEKYTQLLEKKERKYIIVPHASFGFWEERYGIKQIPISGFTSMDEPSQKQLTEIIKTIEKYELDYVLYEQNNKNRLSTVIQEQVGAKDLMIHNLEVRTEEDIEENRNYMDLMEYNLDILDQVTK